MSNRGAVGFAIHRAKANPSKALAAGPLLKLLSLQCCTWDRSILLKSPL